MLCPPEPPQLEADAYQQQITAEPAPGEYGAHTFGRQITSGLRRLLATPVDPPRYRCNPTDRRPCPAAQEYAFTAAGHQVVITCFETTHPLRRGPLPAYAIHLDGQRLPFEPFTFHEVDWQLARTVWIAITDRQLAAARASTPTPTPTRTWPSRRTRYGSSRSQSPVRGSREHRRGRATRPDRRRDPGPAQRRVPGAHRRRGPRTGTGRCPARHVIAALDDTSTRQPHPPMSRSPVRAPARAGLCRFQHPSRKEHHLLLVITHNHAEGTILSGSRKGDGVYDIVKPHGFRYSPQVGIYIRGSRDKDAPRWRIDAAATALRERGHEVTVDIDDAWRPAADRESARSDRAEERADRLDDRADAAAGRRDARQDAADRVLDGIPAGQPMMPGHHSYPADRRRRERAWNNMDQALVEDRNAGQLTDRAGAVRAHDAAKENPRAIMRRIERLEADQRRWQREHDHPNAADAYRQRAQREIDRLAEDIAHQQAKLGAAAATGAFVAWSPANVAKGDLVRVGGHGWYRVTRVNRKSVSLDNDRWPQRITFDELFGRRRDGQQWDTPNGEPWPVELAVAVARWYQHLRAAAVAGYDEPARTQARHVGYAQRLVHGLPLGASDAEVAAFRPDPDDPATLADRRLAAAYLAAFERLEAGELVPDIAASLTVEERQPVWRMPAGDPVDRHPQDLHPGDIIAGIWDRGHNGRQLWPHYAGPHPDHGVRAGFRCIPRLEGRPVNAKAHLRRRGPGDP